MRIQGAGLELGVELAAEKPGVVSDLHHFDQITFLVDAGENQSVGGQHFTIVVVELEPVPVTFGNLHAAICLLGKGPPGQ